jgi:hypothetical protein
MLMLTGYIRASSVQLLAVLHSNQTNSESCAIGPVLNCPARFLLAANKMSNDDDFGVLR